MFSENSFQLLYFTFGNLQWSKYPRLVYTHLVILVIQAILLVSYLGLSDYDVIFTALGGEYKAEQIRCRELGVLPKFHSKAFLKIHKYPSADDFEGKKRLHGV